MMLMNNRLRLARMLTLFALVFALLLVGQAFAAERPDVQPPVRCLGSLNETPSEIPVINREFQRWTTREGANVVYTRAPELPMFDLRVSFSAGSSRDGDTYGLAFVVNGMLNEGTGSQDVKAIAEAFDSAGAIFKNQIDRDSSVISLRSLSSADNRVPSIELFARVIGQPSFPDTALQQVKDQVAYVIKSRQALDSDVTSAQIYNHLYRGHPYSTPTFGTTDSVASITARQVRAFHKKAYTASNSVITLVGDLTRAQAQEIAELISSSLPAGPALAPLDTPGAVEPEIYHIETASPLTEIAIVMPTVGIGDPDYAAIKVANQIFGGPGVTNRLMRELRDRRGLSYGAFSFITPKKAGSLFAIEMQTEARFSEPAMDLTEALFRDYVQQGPTAQELDDAKRYLAASMVLGFGSNTGMIDKLNTLAVHQLPTDYWSNLQNRYQNLTLEQVKQAIARHFDADRLVYISVGSSVEQEPLPEPLERPAKAACVST
jgi:zinc protease